MLKRIFIYSSLLILNSSLLSAQSGKPDTSLSVAAIKTVFQGVWAGPDESYFFLFRGDSVKEWETEGADSAIKPWCSYIIDKTPCDSVSAYLKGTTGYFMRVTCSSLDNDETRCYFILSVDAIELKIGFKGRFDESGHFKKLK